MEPTIYAYISIPEDHTSGADWFNLVLFQNRAFFDRFEQSELHRKAKETLSKESFKTVCVRRGTIRGGIEVSMPCVRVENSVLITYTDDSAEGMERKVHHVTADTGWRELGARL